MRQPKSRISVKNRSRIVIYMRELISQARRDLSWSWRDPVEAVWLKAWDVYVKMDCVVTPLFLCDMNWNKSSRGRCLSIGEGHECNVVINASL